MIQMHMNKQMSAIVVGAIQTVGACLSTILVDRIGRKVRMIDQVNE